jgi:hypothetical protein
VMVAWVPFPWLFMTIFLGFFDTENGCSLRRLVLP